MSLVCWWLLVWCLCSIFPESGISVVGLGHSLQCGRKVSESIRLQDPLVIIEELFLFAVQEF